MKITHPLYKDYPNQPYISPERDVALWEKHPEKFPYSKVERKQMIKTEEGLFPGDIVMLWRIGFDNFTNESVIPNYFEYRYGVDYVESIERLTERNYIQLLDAANTIDLISAPIIKNILKEHNLKVTGKKQELVDRLLSELSVEALEKSFETRRYRITETGKEILVKYDDVIQKHGPKQL